jgi:hypothetical protein
VERPSTRSPLLSCLGCQRDLGVRVMSPKSSQLTAATPTLEQALSNYKPVAGRHDGLIGAYQFVDVELCCYDLVWHRYSRRLCTLSNHGSCRSTAYSSDQSCNIKQVAVKAAQPSCKQHVLHAAAAPIRARIYGSSSHADEVAVASCMHQQLLVLRLQTARYLL